MHTKSLLRTIRNPWVLNTFIIVVIAGISWYARVGTGEAAGLPNPPQDARLAVPSALTPPATTPQPSPTRTSRPSPSPSPTATRTATATATATAPGSLLPRPTDTRWPTVTRTPKGAAAAGPMRWYDPGDLLPSPTATNMSIIGYSVAGRPLQMFSFGSGATGRLIIAGIHGGNEWNTVSLAHELIDEVAAHPEMIPKNITLYILPDLNPDGEARVHGLDGRVNDHGVDLNRNWPWNWQSDWPRAGCWDYRPVSAGGFALSEPETYALYKFIVEHPEIDALISYHAAKLGIFAGGVPGFRPSISLAITADFVSSYDYPPIDTHCTMTGDLTDWAATQNIAAIDIELDNFRYTDFEDNLAILKAFLKWHR